MKLSLVIHHFLPRHTAGAELYAYRQARWLMEQGIQVEVICIEAIDRGSPGEIQTWDEPYDGIPVKRLAFNLLAAGDPWLYNYLNPWLVEWFNGYLENSRPDILHLHSGYLFGAAPIQTAVERRIPTALTLHDYWFVCPQITLVRGNQTICTQIPSNPAECAWCLKQNQRRYRIPDQLSLGLLGKLAQNFGLAKEHRQVQERRLALLSTLGMVDAVISPSPFLSNLVKLYTASSRLHTIPHGLDLRVFQGIRRTTLDGVLRVGYIGQIASHKGVHLLVRAVQSLKDSARPVELHVYGGMDPQNRYASDLIRQARSDPRIRFEGRFENSQVESILASFDVLVVPSLWHEIGPLTILEAFASGTPVICSPLGNMPYLIQDGVNGLFYKAGDAGDLSEKILELANHPEMVEKLRSGIVPPRGLEDEMDQLVKVYRQLSPN